MEQAYKKYIQISHLLGILLNYDGYAELTSFAITSRSTMFNAALQAPLRSLKAVVGALQPSVIEVYILGINFLLIIE